MATSVAIIMGKKPLPLAAWDLSPEMLALHASVSLMFIANVVSELLFSFHFTVFPTFYILKSTIYIKKIAHTSEFL